MNHRHRIALKIDHHRGLYDIIIHHLVRHSLANWITSLFTTHLMNHAQYTWSSFMRFFWCHNQGKQWDIHKCALIAWHSVPKKKNPSMNSTDCFTCLELVPKVERSWNIIVGFPESKLENNCWWSAGQGSPPDVELTPSRFSFQI